MRELSYQVPNGWEGKPVSAYARRELGLSARSWAAVKFQGSVLLNGEPVRASRILARGDLLTLRLHEQTRPITAPPAGYQLSFPILYEDEDFLIAAKPPVMPVHPSPGHDRDDLVTALREYYRLTGQDCPARPMYRLDKDTSGVLPLAKHKIAAGAQTAKQYLAVCEGALFGSGSVKAAIGLEEESKIRRVCGAGPGFLPALTHWRALERREGHTLLAVQIVTGRTHQIRVHMAQIGHPLAGDDLYGGSLERIPRQALHCRSLELACKPLGFRRVIVAPLPRDLLLAFPWIQEALSAPEGDCYGGFADYRPAEPGEFPGCEPGKPGL
jgi:23S rRNA pseudouridine1911/1915/1917 synthase